MKQRPTRRRHTGLVFPRQPPPASSPTARPTRATALAPPASFPPSPSPHHNYHAIYHATRHHHRPQPPPGGVDLVLSSGFLAFAHHTGFLAAVDDGGLSVAGVMGTSAGALTGALYAAGHAPAAVAEELARVAPIRYLRPCKAPWRGLASLDGVVARLRDLLPATFEELPLEFAVGVVDAQGVHTIIDSGPLPEAVAASAAIPGMFAPLAIPHAVSPGPFRDGGVVDRTGLRAWRARRAAQAAARGHGAAPPPPALVHVIHRSSAFSGEDDVASTGERRVLVVQSPRAGAALWSLGDFEGARDAARARAGAAVAAAAAAAWPEGGARIVGGA